MLFVARNLQVRHPRCVDRITSRVKWSETQLLVKREKTNKMQLIWCLLSNFYINTFRASVCPSPGAVGTQCPQLTTQLHTTTANHSQHNQCRTPHTVIHGLVLLVMGILMPETCWCRNLIINIRLVASCWFSLPSPYVHDARSQEPKTAFGIYIAKSCFT